MLDISADEVNVALQRLLRLGLIEMTPATWTDACGDALASLDGVMGRLSKCASRNSCLVTQLGRLEGFESP